MNKELLRRVRDAVAADPKGLDQDYWGRRDGCKTTLCIGGWAVHLAGYQIIWEVDDKNNGLFYAEFCNRKGEDTKLEIEQIAMQELDLPYHQVYRLFQCLTARDVVLDYIDDLLGRTD